MVGTTRGDVGSTVGCLLCWTDDVGTVMVACVPSRGNTCALGRGIWFVVCV